MARELETSVLVEILQQDIYGITTPVSGQTQRGTNGINTSNVFGVWAELCGPRWSFPHNVPPDAGWGGQVRDHCFGEAFESTTSAAPRCTTSVLLLFYDLRGVRPAVSCLVYFCALKAAPWTYSVGRSLLFSPFPSAKRGCFV